MSKSECRAQEWSDQLPVQDRSGHTAGTNPTDCTRLALSFAIEFESQQYSNSDADNAKSNPFSPVRGTGYANSPICFRPLSRSLARSVK